MRTIRKNSPSKSWRLIRVKDTGDILTDDHNLYQYGWGDIQTKINDANELVAAGKEAPSYSLGHYYRRQNYTFNDLEQLDHIPVMRGEFEFDSIHNGTSSIQIYFKSRSGARYTLKGDHANDFFRRVGKGKILMSLDGFYEFNYTFTKASTKVFMVLEPDNAHL